MPPPGGSGMLRFVPRPAPSPTTSTRPRPGRVVLVLVQRDREHARIGEEDRLGAVAVVDVPVDDRDAADAAHLPGRGGSRCRCSRRCRSPSRGRARRGGRAGARGRRRSRPCRRGPRRPRRSRRRPRARRSRRRSGPSAAVARVAAGRAERAHVSEVLGSVHAQDLLVLAGRARSGTSWSSTPVTSSRLRKRRFVSGFSNALLGLHVDFAGVVTKSFQMPASCQA